MEDDEKLEIVLHYLSPRQIGKFVAFGGRLHTSAAAASDDWGDASVMVVCRRKFSSNDSLTGSIEDILGRFLSPSSSHYFILRSHLVHSFNAAPQPLLASFVPDFPTHIAHLLLVDARAHNHAKHVPRRRPPIPVVDPNLVDLTGEKHQERKTERKMPRPEPKKAAAAPRGLHLDFASIAAAHKRPSPLPLPQTMKKKAKTVASL